MEPLLNPDTPKGQVGILFRLHQELTRIGDLEDIEVAILLITHEHDSLHISAVWRNLGQIFGMRVIYLKVWHAVNRLEKKGLVALKKEVHQRGQPNLISIEPQGRLVVQRVLTRAQTFSGVIPQQVRPVLKEIVRNALKLLEPSEQTDRQENDLAELSRLIQIHKIKLNELND